MLRHIRVAILVLAAFTVLLGGVYPLVVAGISRVVFPSAADGSLIAREGAIVGSELVGQSFEDPAYFWGRPSAAGYDAAASSATNRGPLHPDLHAAVAERAARLRAADPENDEPIPVDLVTASASGLDPHIGPSAAYWQVDRVARARGVPSTRVRALVDSHVDGRTFGVLGEPRVNVLRLNLALDEAAPSPSHARAF